MAISVPHVKDRWPDEMAKLEDGGGGGGPLLERARALREEVLGSLAVRDWGLFL